MPLNINQTQVLLSNSQAQMPLNHNQRDSYRNNNIPFLENDIISWLFTDNGQSKIFDQKPEDAVLHSGPFDLNNNIANYSNQSNGSFPRGIKQENVTSINNVISSSGNTQPHMNTGLPQEQISHFNSSYSQNHLQMPPALAKGTPR